jgi:hypothetical protein
MYFFYLNMPEWKVPVTAGGGNDTLRYRYGLIRNQQSYMYGAMLKVPNRLRYTLGRSREAPTIQSMTGTCRLAGDFAPRPYFLGQDTDGCSDNCLFALLHDCCKQLGIDMVWLLRRAYPGSDNMAARVGLIWACMRRDAEWQGTQFPRKWTGDSLTGLALSLSNHYRPRLMEVLLDAIGSR